MIEELNHRRRHHHRGGCTNLLERNQQAGPLGIGGLDTDCE